MKGPLRCLLGIMLLAPPSSAQDSRPIGSWMAKSSKRGDTTVVRTESGSVWGDKVRLVEELRIGTRDGDGPDSFGEIRAFALFPDGVMAVFDQSVPALRLFDPAGEYLRTLGRSGAGPGEYRNDVLGLVVDRDGVLLMYDLRNNRLNRWKRDGTVLPAWKVGSPSIYAFLRAIQVDTAGNTYLLVAAGPPEPGKYPKRGLARFDRSGNLADTLQQPTIEGPDDPPLTPFSPYKYWLLSRAGSAVTAFSGIYAITVSGPGRNVIRIERAIPRVGLLPDERRSYQEYMEARSGVPMASTPRPTTSLPSTKPQFSQLHSDLDGRIWVKLHTKAEPFDPPVLPLRQGQPKLPPIRWRERVVWDVFQRDGRYLGQLELPRETDLSEAKGSRIWAIQRGEDDEQYVVRYRIAGMR